MRLPHKRRRRLFAGGDQNAHVGARIDAGARKFAFDRLERQSRRVVLIADMPQNDLPRSARNEFGGEPAGGEVRQMAAVPRDPSFQKIGIRPAIEHIEIVIRFEQDQVGAEERGLHVERDVSQIGGDRRGAAVVFDSVSHRVGENALIRTESGSASISGAASNSC